MFGERETRLTADQLEDNRREDLLLVFQDDVQRGEEQSRGLFLFFFSLMASRSCDLLLNHITTHHDMHLQNSCETSAARNHRDSEGNLSEACR